jgi:threonine/homoserine/homoserine lactone efflux protein
VLGNAAGAYTQVVVVALGLGTLIERSATLFTAVKLVGAMYVVFLGVQAFRHRERLASVIDAATAPRGTRRILREGYVVGITNPKSAVFMAAVLPQFADPGRGHVPLQLLLLGLVFVAIALVSDSIWGLAAGSARVWLGRSPRRLAPLGGLFRAGGDDNGDARDVFAVVHRARDAFFHAGDPLAALHRGGAGQGPDGNRRHIETCAQEFTHPREYAHRP